MQLKILHFTQTKVKHHKNFYPNTAQPDISELKKVDVNPPVVITYFSRCRLRVAGLCDISSPTQNATWEKISQVTKEIKCNRVQY